MSASIGGFILVGGRSSRMGTDKSTLTLEGQTLVARVRSALSSITSSVHLVGNSPLSNTVEPRVHDLYEGWGALGGLHASLSACRAEWAVVVACDLPFVTGSLFSRLAALRQGFEAVAPIQSDTIPQPLCALYRVDPCLGRAIELIESGERRPIALLQSVKTRWVTFEELSDLKGSKNFFDNINTPSDYVRARAKGGSSQAKG